MDEDKERTLEVEQEEYDKLQEELSEDRELHNQHRKGYSDDEEENAKKTELAEERELHRQHRLGEETE